MNELPAILPCHCGGAGAVESRTAGRVLPNIPARFKVRCIACRDSLRTLCATPEEAIEVWNTSFVRPTLEQATSMAAEGLLRVLDNYVEATWNWEPPSDWREINAAYGCLRSALDAKTSPPKCARCEDYFPKAGEQFVTVCTACYENMSI